jgi:hypothetical protein
MAGLRLASAAFAGGVAAALVAGQAAVAHPFNLGDELFGSHKVSPEQVQSPPVGRYVDEDGDITFILDRSSPQPMLRFEDSPEIWVLTPQPGPRGDIIYRNDMGEPVLRATRLGGMTLFTVTHPTGAAAAFVGEAQVIRPAPVLSPQALAFRLAQASARVSHVMSPPRVVVFEARDWTPQTASLIADAAAVTAEAVVVAARSLDGRRAVAKLGRVILSSGHKATAIMTGPILQVTVSAKPGSPFWDVSGRPSSRRIDVALTGQGQ